MENRRQNLLKLHAKVRANIEKRNGQYVREANKGHVMTFEPRDCIWVCKRKERFPTQRKYKLQPRGDETFQVLERINDNAYKLNLSTTYGEEFDLRMNPFEEGGNDRNPTNKAKDNLRDTGGLMTRSKTKMVKQSLLGLCLGIKENLEQSELEAAPKWDTLLQVDEENGESGPSETEAVDSIETDSISARPCSPAAHCRRSPIRVAQWHYPLQLSSSEATSSPVAMSLLEKRVTQATQGYNRQFTFVNAVRRRSLRAL
ncbi:hypothetical protein CR513_23791, partial [Mucuna pruriens]